MPLGAALDENQPVLGADAIDALRLTLTGRILDRGLRDRGNNRYQSTYQGFYEQ